jgi:hypothetical protein
LLVEYNKRGFAERQFDFMKNDFGWRLPPFMRLNQNTVFLIAAALANNIYRGILNSFKEKLPALKETFRVNKFRTVFIEVICYLVEGGYVFRLPKFDYDKVMT